MLISSFCIQIIVRTEAVCEVVCGDMAVLWCFSLGATKWIWDMIKHARNLLEEMPVYVGDNRPPGRRGWASRSQGPVCEPRWRREVCMKHAGSPYSPRQVQQSPWESCSQRQFRGRLCLPGTSSPLVSWPCSVLSWKKPLGGLALAQEVSQSSSQSLQTVPPQSLEVEEFHHARLIHCHVQKNAGSCFTVFCKICFGKLVFTSHHLFFL